MKDIGSLVERLVEAGLSVGEASSIIAEAVAAGAASAAAPSKSSGAARTERWRENKRHKASQSVTESNPEEPSRTVTNRHKASQCDADTILPIDTNIKNSKRQNSERSSRGTRIDPNWKPSDADRAIALQEGFSESETAREALRFRDYWSGRAGSGGVKLDWASTWRNWVRTSADRLGKRPVSSETTEAGTGFYAKFGSEEQDAWDQYGKAKSGRTFPRDSKGGWRHPTQWPPGYKPQSHTEAPPPPVMRTMQ